MLSSSSSSAISSLLQNKLVVPNDTHPSRSSLSSSASSSSVHLPSNIPYTSFDRSAKAMQNIHTLLELDKVNNANENWNKLNRTIRMRKLADFAQRYKSENALSNEEHDQLVAFFNQCLDQKKLHKVKEVLYDAEKGIITAIPSLAYERTTKHYTLKNITATPAAKRNTTKRATKTTTSASTSPPALAVSSSSDATMEPTAH